MVEGILALCLRVGQVVPLRHCAAVRGAVNLLQHQCGGAWRSSVARLVWDQEVPGSNPGAPIQRKASPEWPLCQSGFLCFGTKVPSVLSFSAPHSRALPDRVLLRMWCVYRFAHSF